MPSNDVLDPSTTRLRDRPELETPAEGSPERDQLTGPESPSWESWDGSELGDVDHGPSQTSTSREARPSRAFTDPDTFLEPISSLVGIGGFVVHTVRRAPGTVWLVDDEDVASIAGPLARIAARHSPVHGGEASDLADGISAGLGVANYAVKNIRLQAELVATTPAPPVPPPPPPPEPYQPTS